MEQVQARQPRHQDAAVTERTEGADLRDEQLSEDVACCLAEIDKVLEEGELTEREQAEQEWRRLKDRSIDADAAYDMNLARDMRLWEAKYAHLGLHVGHSCCGFFAYDDDGEKIS